MPVPGVSKAKPDKLRFSLLIPWGVAAIKYAVDAAGKTRGVVSDTIFVEFAAVAPDVVARPTVASTL